MSARSPHPRKTDTPAATVATVAGASNAEAGVAELVLNDSGMIRECNRVCGKLLGYLPTELVWRHVSVLLPQLQGMPLMLGGHINPRLLFLTHIGRRFEVIGVGGVRLVCEIFIHEVEPLGRHCLRLLIRPVEGVVSVIGGIPGRSPQAAAG